jgi:hypothetical protein
LLRLRCLARPAWRTLSIAAGGYGGGGYDGGVYVAPLSYGYQSRYRTVCRYERVAAGYDYYGQPIYRRQQMCQQVAY